jgi:hypothetical protein
MSHSIDHAPPASRGWMIVALLLLTILGACFRCASVYQYVRDKPDDPSRLAGDEQGYESLAHGVTQGEFFTWQGRVPGYPLFIAGVYELTHTRSVNGALYMQAIFNSLGIPLTFLLARCLMRPVSSFIASAVVAIDPTLITHNKYLYTEAVYVPLLLVSVFAIYWARYKPNPLRFAIVGTVIAIMTLTRPTSMLLPAIVMAALPMSVTLGRRIALTVVCFIVMAATIAPWTWHNWRTHHAFIPLAPSTAVLWQGSPEYYHLVQTKSYHEIWQDELNPRHNGGHDPFTADGDRWFSQRAIASIKSEPIVYAKYCIKKASYFWFGNSLMEWPYKTVIQRTPVVEALGTARWLQMWTGRNFAWLGLAALFV